MADYFEPVSVLGLGRVLGLGHVSGDTLRRWFHGLAQGAINFEDDPARWEISDATGAEIDRELGPVLERLWREPDESTISTMLQHAEGGFEERVARDPADAQGDPARRHAGARARRRLDAARLAPVGSGSRRRRRSRGPGQGCRRGRPALALADRDADPPVRRRRRAGWGARCRRAPTWACSSPPRTATRTCGARPPTHSTCSARAGTTQRSASGRISARVTTSRASR